MNFSIAELTLADVDVRRYVRLKIDVCQGIHNNFLLLLIIPIVHFINNGGQNEKIIFNKILTYPYLRLHDNGTYYSNVS